MSRGRGTLSALASYQDSESPGESCPWAGERIMRRFAIGILLLGLASALAARADDWSKTFPITGTPELRVETSDANINVETWDQKTIEARVTTEGYKIGDGGIQIFPHQTGDSVELEVRFPHSIVNFGFNHHRVDIQIHMPRQGRVALHTGDGSIQLTGLKGEMDVETGDGHQQIDSVDGTLHARSGDGHIRAAGRFDGLEITAGDGSVEAQAQSGSTMNAPWTLHAGDGSVTLQLPAKFAADVDLHTGDGHITLDLPVSVEGRLRENNIRGKLNGGGGLLTINTGDGSIQIEKF
jgi:DUF4097 and DUF4098 domain-containing protein YvlB